LWKHIEEERNRSRDNYKRHFIDIKGRNKGNFDNYFKQYVAACKRDEEDDSDFKAYIHDADNSKSNAREPNNSSTYITTFGTLTIEKATSISVELANKAYTHLLTASELTIESTTEPYMETDPFAYSTATTIALQYTSTVFMGIIINIGASRKFMAGYSQFQAL